MEFWGVEVKPGETLKVNPGESKYLHLSQASLGEVKKDKSAENVPAFVKFGNQKLVLGTLSADKYPQIQYDLVFEKEFELSHNSKNTSVFFCGYKTLAMEDDGFDQFSEGSDFESEEDVPEAIPLSKSGNGKPAVKVEEPKAQAAMKEIAIAKSKSKVVESAKAEKQKIEKEDDDNDDDDDDEDNDDSEEDDSDEEMALGEDDSSDEDEDEDDSSDDDEKEDEETPKKVQAGNKRPLGSASKTPVTDKKAKLVSPMDQKAGASGKKQGHAATPHPAKQVAKTPANDNSKQQTPKSTCKSCSKSFNSEIALQAHTKAKHA